MSVLRGTGGNVSKNFKGKPGKPHQINENIENLVDPLESSEASGTVSLMKPSLQFYNKMGRS